MVDKVRHQDLHLGLQVGQVVTLNPRSRQHHLVVVNPPQKNNEVPVLLLLGYLVEVGNDLGLYVLLVGLLVYLHYGKLLGKTRNHVVVYVHQVLGGKLGLLYYPNQVLLLRQLLLETHLDRLLYHRPRPLPQYPLLALGLQSIVVVLYHPHRHFHCLRLLLRKLDAVRKSVEYLIEKCSLKVVNLHELLPHDCRLSLPGGVLQQTISELNQVQQFVPHNQVLALVLRQFFESLHFSFHIDEVGELLNDFSDVGLEDVESEDVLHEIVELGSFLPHRV